MPFRHIESKIVKTRKDHACFGCSTFYPSGNEMVRSTIETQGEIISGYFCKYCSDFDKYREELKEAQDEQG